MVTNRRKFLSTLGIAGLAGVAAANPLNKIDQVQQNEVQKSGIKITGLKTFVLPRAILVKLETNAGIDGWGESSPNNTRLIETFIQTDMKERVIGRDPFDVEPIWDELFWYNHDLGPGGALPYAIAGIDLALWDLKVKY
jgi:L-alanine-DL-glutamate epimerase-like enolase superfamily enzyme